MVDCAQGRLRGVKLDALAQLAAERHHAGGKERVGLEVLVVVEDRVEAELVLLDEVLLDAPHKLRELLNVRVVVLEEFLKLWR